MDGQSFQHLDIADFGRELQRLHEQVAVGRGRVEIHRPGCADACVMISKAELESLEQALEILASTDDFQSMRQMLTELAGRCRPDGA